MRFRKKIDPLIKFVIFASTYLFIVGAVTAYLLFRIMNLANPGEINTRIALLYKDKVVQYGIEKNSPQYYIEGIPIPADHGYPYSRNETMNNGYVLRFEPGTSDGEIKFISETYNRMFHAELYRKTIILLGSASLAWLVPCLVLYGVGWKFRWWVRSGGKVKDLAKNSIRGTRTRRGNWKKSIRTYYAGE